MAILLLSPTCFARGHQGSNDFAVKCKTTTYNPTKKQCGDSKNISLSGVHGKLGMCAADKRIFPIGSILYCIDTSEVMIVGDTGPGVKGYHIDRWVRRLKDNKLYCGGKLGYYILYKAPKSSSSQWKTMVEQNFAIRARIMKCQEYQLVSRGGYVKRDKSLICKKLKERTQQELKRIKEHKKWQK